MTLPFDLNLFDALLLGLIAVFTVRGALRGFLAEMAGLVGIVAGVWLAGRYYPAAGKLIHEWTASSWSNTIAYVVVLCGVLIAVSLVSRVHGSAHSGYRDAGENPPAGSRIFSELGSALIAPPAARPPFPSGGVARPTLPSRYPGTASPNVVLAG